MEDSFNEKQSLELIARMINKAKIILANGESFIWYGV